MSRVKAVVDNSIMVNLEDVVPTDIIYITGDERDPIVAEIVHEGPTIKFRYVPGGAHPNITETVLMDVTGNCFVHDLKNERAEFIS